MLRGKASISAELVNKNSATYHFTDGPGVMSVEIGDIGGQEQAIIANIEANERLGFGTVGVNPLS